MTAFGSIATLGRHRSLSRNSLSMIEGGTMPGAQMAAKVCWRLKVLPRKELRSTRLSPDASDWWLAREHLVELRFADDGAGSAEQGAEVQPA